MTYDDIIRIARKAGWSGIYTKPLFSITMQEDDFLRFAALVAAAEREACAKVCADKVDAEYATGKVDHNEMAWTQACAIDIRARGTE